MNTLKKLTKENLLDEPQLKGFELFHVEPNREDYLLDNGLQLITENLKDFVSFCKKHQIKNLYYFFEPYDAEDYYIYPWNLDQGFGLDLFELIENEVQQHNDAIDEIDFSRNHLGFLYALFEGQIIYMVLIDDWLEDQGIFPAFMTTQEMMMNRMDEVSEVIENRDEHFSEALDILHEEILKSPHFRYQTTKKKRYDFFLDYLENEADEVIESIFFSPDGEPDVFAIRDFIEQVWKDKKMLQ